jgi:hypothetical protein
MPQALIDQWTPVVATALVDVLCQVACENGVVEALLAVVQYRMSISAARVGMYRRVAAADTVEVVGTGWPRVVVSLLMVAVTDWSTVACGSGKLDTYRGAAVQTPSAILTSFSVPGGHTPGERTTRAGSVLLSEGMR